MATVNFWDGMDKATEITGADKMMIGKNATGEAQYTDFELANQFISIQGIEMKPVPAGALPAGPSGETRKMQIIEPGDWTWNGQTFTNPEGSIMNLWWDGTTWSLGSSVELPQQPLPIGVVNSDSGSFDFNVVTRKLTVTGIGSVNIGKTRYLYNTPQTIDFPVETTGYYALIFDPSTLNFAIYLQTALGSLPNTNLFIATVFLNNTTGEFVVNGLADYLVNSIKKEGYKSTWVGRKYKSGSVVYDKNYFWEAVQDTLEGSEPEISDRWLPIDKFRRGQLTASPSYLNFNLNERKLYITGTVSFSINDKRIIINTPQTIDFPSETGGYYAILSTIAGVISIVPIASLDTVSSRLFFLATFYHNSNTNTFNVNGITDYFINSQPRSFILPSWVDRAYRVGESVMYNGREWVAQDPNPIVGSVPGVSARWKERNPRNIGFFSGPASSINFDLANRKILTSGTSAVVIPNERMLITAGQIVDFPANTSGYYALLFQRSGGTLITSLISQMGSLDTALVMIATFYHNSSTNELVVNGIPDYYVNGQPRPSGQVTLERKFSFDTDVPYYNATTTLSMTDTDPIVLKDQFVDYLYGLYDGLVSQFPDYVSKTQFGEQEDTGGARLPLYYYRFRPSNLIKNTGFGGDERLKIVITAATHGGEKTCGMAAWILMDAICNQWKDDEFLEALRWNCEFVVVACASPYQWNQNALGLSPGRKNLNGVDPNRNYPVGWAGGSDNPSDQDYRGPSPLSEIETQAVSALLQAEFVTGAIAFDFHTFVNSTTDPKDISWVITTQKTNPSAQAWARRLAREYKKKLPTAPQGDDVPFVRVSSAASGGMTYKYYDALGYKSYLMEINENFQIVPDYVRNDNYALKFGTESLANMLREVIKSSLV
ncbi:hypothetical protein HX021_08350 [Sphingobacterium sp. N143]|uniref:M14 family metallopeptidase n=1 Tax=Sphingobacterium sp. N143 TaxID=2746727 RepID=UPI002578A448|nr:M14 family metallopeptidase [Sphingobacterium sp. N143]MDM1294308.1 hypothetical protein [Sphingobacterium sp. N143]